MFADNNDNGARLRRLLELGAAGAWLVMGLLTLLDVIGRELLGQPIPGAYELIQLLMAIGLFSSLPIVALEKGHVVVDVLRQSFPAGVRALIERIAYLASAAFFLLLGVAMFQFGRHAWGTGERTVYLGIPFWLVALFMAALLLVTVVCCLLAKHAPLSGPAEE